MRIGIDASCWENKRGFGRFTREVVYALDQDEALHEYFLFLDGPAPETLRNLSKVTWCPVQTSHATIEAASSEGRRALGDVWAMTREVKRHGLDLFYFPAVYSYFPILNRIPICVTIHDMIPELHPQEVFPNKKLRFFWQLKQQLAIWQSRTIVTVSEFSKRQIVEQCQISQERVRVMPEGPGKSFHQGVDPQKIAPVLQQLGIARHERFLLYVGGLSPHKNLRMLLDGYSELIQEEGFQDIRLVLVGDYQSDSFFSDYPALKGMSESGRLKDRVIFTGFIQDEELACVYSAATCLVFPSLLEGFGLPAIEAMSCGTPVVASETGSLPEVLGEAGCFFNPYSKESLLLALRNTLESSDRRLDMKRLGLERAKAYTWERAATELLSIFSNSVTKN